MKHLLWLLLLPFLFAGTPASNPPQYSTIYASPIAITSPIAPSTNNGALLAAETHANVYLNDLEDLVTQPYWGNSHLYLQYGVSTWNCTDHDHRTAIATSNGVSAVGWTHDVQWSGTMWFQIVSQCEEAFDSDPNGNGAYWKGEQWYVGFDYPLVPEKNIWVQNSYVTNCAYPQDINPSAREYGCGSDDIF